MSNPNRSLSNRPCKPFYSNGIYSKLNCSNKKTVDFNMEIVGNSLQDLSDTMVRDYLLHHPNFIEKFILENYSLDKIKELLANIEHNSVKMVSTSPLSLTMNRSRSLTELLSVKENQLKNLSYRHILVNHLPDLSNRLMQSPKCGQMKQSENKNITIDFDNKDLCSTKLDLLEEMKRDISSILGADRSYLYLADGKGERLYLSHSNQNESFEISDQSILASYVARNKVSINIPDIFMDERFNPNTYDTFIQSVMATPIVLRSGELVAVIELYRSATKPIFSSKEEEIFINYCIWTSLAVYYNEIRLINQKQERLNKFILDVTQKMFGKFTNMDLIIKEIMASAKNLVKAERVSLFLLDKTCNELFARIFDKGTYGSCQFETSDTDIRFGLAEGIAGQVAHSGETLNIADAYSDMRFNRNIDQQTGYVTRSILCMPVKVEEEVIGVMQMLNKQSGNFTPNDENDFRTFSVYCGLALHIAKMYEKIMRSQQKYEVALDVLSYHSGFNQEEFDNIKRAGIPTVITNIDDILYWPWKINDNDQPITVIYMFKDLFGLDMNNYSNEETSDDFYRLPERFEMDTLLKFVLTVKRNYRDVAYHNWAHAFSVAHAMYAILKTTKHKFNIFESLALFVACLCHDLDHRGKTNKFMAHTSSTLSALYTTSTMEHHHFNMTVTILQRPGHNIFQHLSSPNYRKVLSLIKHCILSTDLVKFFDFKNRIENSHDKYDMNNNRNRLNLMAITMTFCDLCSMFKQWEMQLTLVMTIMEEFWCEGDESKYHDQVPLRMMDREYRSDLPLMQMDFLREVCIPCYRLVAEYLPELRCVVESAQDNYVRWSQLTKLDETARCKQIDQLEFFVKQFIVKHSIYINRYRVTVDFN